MKILKVACLAVSSFLIHVPLIGQSPSKPAYIQYRALYEPGMTPEFIREYKSRFLAKLKDLGLPAGIYPRGSEEFLILAGPFTTRESFAAALAAITSQDHVESQAPYFLPSASVDSDSGSGATAPNLPAGRNEVPDTAAAIRWMQDAIKESGGVIRGIAIEPTGVASDVIGPNHELDIEAGGISFGIDAMTDGSVLYWKEVRSVDVVNDGSIDIWTTIHVKRKVNRWNSDNTGSYWEEVSSRPVHVRFWLAATNPQRNMQFANTLRGIVENSRQ